MTYNLPHVKPHVVNAANEVGTRFGLKTIGGWRPRDQFPDHPSGLALDYMINNAGGRQTGQNVADYLVANAKRLGVKYLIWNRQSWNPERGTWARYTSTDNPHTDHVHATFKDKAPGGGGVLVPVPSLPGLPSPGDLVGAMSSAADALHKAAGGINAVGSLAEKAMWLALPTSQIRIVAGILGVIFIFFGVAILGKQAAAG